MKNVTLMTVFNTIQWWYLIVAFFLGPPCTYLNSRTLYNNRVRYFTCGRTRSSSLRNSFHCAEIDGGHFLSWMTLSMWCACVVQRLAVAGWSHLLTAGWVVAMTAVTSRWSVATRHRTNGRCVVMATSGWRDRASEPRTSTARKVGIHHFDGSERGAHLCCAGFDALGGRKPQCAFAFACSATNHYQ